MSATQQEQLPSGYQVISLCDMHSARKAADKAFKAQASDAGFSWQFHYTRQIEVMVAKRVTELLAK